MDLIERQAAIDELIKMLGDCFQADEELVDAVVTTVKELPSVQPENARKRTETRACDLIDRQAVLALPRNIERNMFGEVVEETIHVAHVKRIPSVDAVPVRRGRWIPKFGGIFKCGAYWYDCSECGHTVPGGLQSGKKFCENCGARMGDSHE